MQKEQQVQTLAPFFYSYTSIEADEEDPEAPKKAMKSLKYVAYSVAIAIACLAAACSTDEPEKPSESGSDNKVTINANGTATGGAVFADIDGTTFFIDYVKYKIVDVHLEIVGYDETELPQEPKLYSEVTIGGATYKTRVIAARAFYESNITKISIPSTVQELKDRIFTDCKYLTKIQIPDGVTSIGHYCFSGCTSLTEIVIPDGVTSIGHYCFSWCTSLTEIQLSKNINTLPYECFRYCESLRRIDIPANIKYIENNCFYRSSLEEIYFYGSVPDFSYAPWNGLEVKPTAYVPEEYIDEYKRTYLFSEVLPLP